MTTVVMPSGLVGATETILAYCAFLIWPDQTTLLFSTLWRDGRFHNVSTAGLGLE
ncbi:MAG: hypothetical protein M0C28_30685 [Candidatus Moduliflexus flocculans]|nr:hypothetical protein [Candidatus Moduliflexus flocculans]